MNKPSIKELKDIYRGRAVAVLGGGPSLPADLKRLPVGTNLISVNGHSLRLRGADYLVFCDNPYRKSRLTSTLLAAAIDAFYGPKISIIENDSDYIFDVDFWNGGFSSTVATWLACYMGGDPVLLCGMDCYQGDEKYFFDYSEKMEHPCWHYPLENNLKAWRPALSKCPGPEKIKAISGPLVEIFGEYKSDA